MGTITLKFDGFQVGQKIRAYDFQPFPGRPECFIEGEIVNVARDHVYVDPFGGHRVPFAHYAVRCTRDVFEGKVHADSYNRVGLTIYVPMETSIDFDGRVSLVESPIDRIVRKNQAMWRMLDESLPHAERLAALEEAFGQEPRP